MTSDPNENLSNADGAVVGEDAQSPHEPNYSELSSGTSSRDADWEAPTSAPSVLGESTASAPDPSPLLDEQAGGARSAAQGQFWNEGGQISGATSNSRPIPPEQPENTE